MFHQETFDSVRGGGYPVARTPLPLGKIVEADLTFRPGRVVIEIDQQRLLVQQNRIGILSP